MKSYQNVKIKSSLKENYLSLNCLKLKVITLRKKRRAFENNHLNFYRLLWQWVLNILIKKHKYCEETGLPLIELKCKWV
jgi:hypothetical protein